MKNQHTITAQLIKSYKSGAKCFSYRGWRNTFRPSVAKKFDLNNDGQAEIEWGLWQDQREKQMAYSAFKHARKEAEKHYSDKRNGVKTSAPLAGLADNDKAVQFRKPPHRPFSQEDLKKLESKVRKQLYEFRKSLGINIELNTVVRTKTYSFVDDWMKKNLTLAENSAIYHYWRDQQSCFPSFVRMSLEYFEKNKVYFR